MDATKERTSNFARALGLLCIIPKYCFFIPYLTELKEFKLQASGSVVSSISDLRVWYQLQIRVYIFWHGKVQYLFAFWMHLRENIDFTLCSLGSQVLILYLHFPLWDLDYSSWKNQIHLVNVFWSFLLQVFCVTNTKSSKHDQRKIGSLHYAQPSVYNNLSCFDNIYYS